MKRNLILTFLACGASAMLSTAAQAQTTQPTAPATSGTCPACPACPAGPECHAGHKHGGGILEHLTSALSLTGTQQAQIAAILEQAKPQFQAIQQDAQTKRKALVDSTAAQITPLLTTDQQTKFTQLVQQFENGPAEGGPGRAPFARHGGPGAAFHGNVLEKMTSELGLTTDQQSQIKPLLDAAHAQVQAIRQDTTLTKEQKFAKVKETMEAAHSQINGILTPAQQQQLATHIEEMKAKYHRGHGPESEPAASPSASPATN